MSTIIWPLNNTRFICLHAQVTENPVEKRKTRPDNGWMASKKLTRWRQRAAATGLVADRAGSDGRRPISHWASWPSWCSWWSPPPAGLLVARRMSPWLGSCHWPFRHHWSFSCGRLASSDHLLHIQGSYKSKT